MKRAVRIVRFEPDDTKNHEKSLEIRTRVFIREQNVEPELEYEFEDESHLYLLYFKDEAVGTARWRDTEQGVKLERFAILPEFRNMGLGTQLLEAVMKDALRSGRPIYLHSQLKALSYYHRAGFRKKGNKFTEADIDHYLMVYECQ